MSSAINKLLEITAEHPEIISDPGEPSESLIGEAEKELFETVTNFYKREIKYKLNDAQKK